MMPTDCRLNRPRAVIILKRLKAADFITQSSAPATTDTAGLWIESLTVACFYEGPIIIIVTVAPAVFWQGPSSRSNSWIQGLELRFSI